MIEHIILIVACISIAIGLYRGFVRECMTLMGWILGLWFAWHYTTSIQNYCTRLIESAPLRHLLVFGALFLLIVFGSAVIGLIIRRFLHHSGLSVVDRSLGVLFGALRAAVLITLSFWMIIQSPGLSKKWHVYEIYGYSYVHISIHAFQKWFPNVMRALQNWSRSYLDQQSNASSDAQHATLNKKINLKFDS